MTDIYSSGTLSKADWVGVQKTIRESEKITRRKLALGPGRKIEGVNSKGGASPDFFLVVTVRVS